MPICSWPFGISLAACMLPLVGSKGCCLVMVHGLLTMVASVFKLYNQQGPAA